MPKTRCVLAVFLGALLTTAEVQATPRLAGNDPTIATACAVSRVSEWNGRSVFEVRLTYDRILGLSSQPGEPPPTSKQINLLIYDDKAPRFALLMEVSKTREGYFEPHGIFYQLEWSKQAGWNVVDGPGGSNTHDFVRRYAARMEKRTKLLKIDITGVSCPRIPDPDAK